MKVMCKQSFKNMGYCWLISDTVKNSFIQYIVVLSPRKLANVMEVLGEVFELWCAWMDDDSYKIVFS